MMKISKSTKDIIAKLGYEGSDNFYYFTDLKSCKDISLHDSKVIKILRPVAFFVVKGKPKVLFFDYENIQYSEQELYKKIWNYQVPIVIFNDYNTIKIYNGNNMNLSDITNLKLEELARENVKHCNYFSPFSYWNITNEAFLYQYTNSFSNKTLNEVMIDNIRCVTNKLKDTYHIQFATKLILRIIFIRFLIDRGISIDYEKFCGNVVKDRQYFLDIIREKEKLYSLFEYLKDKFNGNLFELDNEKNCNNLTEDVFRLLEIFISGTEEMENGQISLFPVYDFNIIPVELISNIYEILLGEKAQKKDKAFYTPEYLVDYMVKETISPHLTNGIQIKVLDPACGSGVFLVQVLRNILDLYVDENGYINDNYKLISIVKNVIYGIDLNSEAIDITIFSIYLTLFDYKNPKSLNGFKLPDLKNSNLFVSDFFDDNKLSELRKISFDFIIGNPPWGSIKEGKHIEYCKEKRINNQNYEISRSFIAKARDYSNDKTVIMFIIPSKIFYNQQKPAIQFRQNILKSCYILKFIELSSVRNLIFKKAKAPASILIYQYKEENCLEHNMIHVSLKPNIFFKLFKVIVTEKYDVKTIKQKILFDNDWAWKTCVYGFVGDIENILMLKKKYKTLNETIKENRLKRASGISSNEGEKDASCFMGRDIISSYSIDTFCYQPQKKKFNKEKIYRIGKPDVYYPPYCLIRKGVDLQTYRFRSAYVEDDVIFEQAISAIKGKIDQKKLLLNISGVLNSSLYVYLNLMMGSSIGIERGQIFMNEYITYPFVYDDRISELTYEIQSKNSNINNIMYYNLNDEINKLDKLILKLSGLNDNVFIDYALNVTIPMINNENVEYKQASIDDMLTYAKVFQDYWNSIMHSENKFIQITLYKDIMKKFCVFELNVLEEPTDNEIIVKEHFDDNDNFLAKFMINKINDQFYDIKDIIHFGYSSFYIIKTNEAKNWHKAMGYIDNASVIKSILSAEEGE